MQIHATYSLLKRTLLSLLKRGSILSGRPCFWWVVGANKDNLITLSKRFPLAEMHYDGFITEEILQELNKEIGYDRLTVWSPYKNDLTSWVKVEFICEDLVNLISKYGKVGAWILENPTEFEDIKNFNINVVETTGGIKPNK